MKRFIVLLSRLSPITKTILALLGVGMIVATIAEISHITSWAAFITGQITFGTINGILITYFLMQILTNQKKKDTKDNYIRKELFTKIDKKADITMVEKLELKLVHLEDEVKELKELINTIKDDPDK